MVSENAKLYKGEELANLFFRPSFTGPSAEAMGIRVLYNMPIPTILQAWSRGSDVLQEYSNGWSGMVATNRQQATVEMRKIKAESSFAASDYFSRVYETLVCNGDINMGDLSGTDLEKAETQLFRNAIAEGVRATMWAGDTTGEISSYTTFNGLLRHIADAIKEDTGVIYTSIPLSDEVPATSEILATVWNQSNVELQTLAAEGNLAYFVTSDIYHNFITELDAKGTDSAYRDYINGHEKLAYHGIPIIEVPLSKYLPGKFSSFALLTDRRNLVLALNTADMPDTEVRMWYNPDEMENRQRACFMAGTHIIDPEIVSIFYRTN